MHENGPTEFRTRDGRAAGLSTRHLNSSAYSAPFHGARTSCTLQDLADVARAYRPLLRPGVAIAGPSAAAVYGLPLPTRLQSNDTVHLAVGIDSLRPRGRGVASRVVGEHAFSLIEFDGLTLTAPALTWALLARECSVGELVRIGDAIISDNDDYVGRHRSFTHGSLDDLAIGVHRWMSCTGVQKLREALPLVREHVASPPETDLRTLLNEVGVDDLEVNADIVTNAGEFVARVDLLDRQLGMVFEYQGDGHRTDQKVWRRDVARFDDLAALGYIVTQATGDDLYLTREHFVRRVLRNRERALSRRLESS